jgi:predicted metalloprotease
MGRRSQNVEDRRGMGSAVRVGGLGGFGLLVVLGIALIAGVNPLELIGMLGEAPVEAPAPRAPIGPGPDAPAGRGPGSPGGSERAAADPQADFVSVILADTEDTWIKIFAASGKRYAAPRLVLFTQATASKCGLGQAAMGPFYCPLDRQVYIDLAFFRELDRRFGAPGDFAQAYVIAHEVGHHVQNLLGISKKVQDLRERSGQKQANALSVLQELQADCFAGVWAHHANRQRNILEPGDVEEGLRAAAVIGDDMMQRRAQGHVVPESWTHGSSAQRVQWLRRGLTAGRVDQCDTFDSARR